MTSYAFADLITFTRASAATYVNSSGNITTAASGNPRFDYDPATLAPRGLLVEEQRTNLLLYSEQFDNGTWSKLRATVTADSTTSPDGTADADTLLDTAVAGTHVAIQTITKAASAITYAATVYAKQSTLSKGELRVSDQAGNGVRAAFDLAAGTVGSATGFGTGFTAVSSAITSAGNGWYRITLIATSNSATTLGHEVYLADGSGSTSYTGTGAGIFLYGAQLEAGSFATSYIPTTASQVTRAADVAVIQAPNFAPWYNSAEGTFVIEYSLLSASHATNKNVLTFSDGTGSNRITVYNTATTALPFLLVTDGGVTQASGANAAIGSNVVAKTGVGYKVNDFALITNGGTAATDTSGTVPAAVNRVYIAGSATGAQPINGHIRSIKYYPSRLTNAQIQGLTA